MVRAFQTDRALRDGPLFIHNAAGKHLRDALEQMDLLLGSRAEDEGLEHLVGLLMHLQAVRRALT